MTMTTFFITLLCVIFCTKLPFTQADGSQEPCPPPASTDISEACTYDVRKFGHFRNCTVDIFMSLCSLLNPTTADWPFICTNPNYCLGCRYGYGNCAAMNKTSTDEQLFYLSWFDGIVLGGKYSVCDMGTDILTGTLFFDECFNNVHAQLEECSVQFMQFFQANNRFECSDMNTRISCFLDAITSCGSNYDTPFNIYQQYFRGVVSLTQCQGQIPVVGGAFVWTPNVFLLVLGAVTALMLNRISS